jgi:hypothetical protein
MKNSRRKKNYKKSFKRKFSRNKLKNKLKNKSRNKSFQKKRGGFVEENRGTWTQVIFDEEEKQKIREYVIGKSSFISADTILDDLFPNMRNEIKSNAAYEIQVILGRAYAGN